jgi:hypothetical protein
LTLQRFIEDRDGCHQLAGDCGDGTPPEPTIASTLAQRSEGVLRDNANKSKRASLAA